jgi:hypothetical protein
VSAVRLDEPNGKRHRDRWSRTDSAPRGRRAPLRVRATDALAVSAAARTALTAMNRTPAFCRAWPTPVRCRRGYGARTHPSPRE